MDFYEVLEQVLVLLQRHRRVSHRALKLQFQLDDDYFEALREELTEVLQIATDQDSKMLVWTGDPVAPEPGVHRRAEAESRFHALIRAVMWMLHNERRLTYSEIKHIFSLDDTLLEEIREELTFRRLAIDEDGKGLVWTGEIQPTVQPAIPIPKSTPTAFCG